MQLRKDAGLNQVMLAARLGITQSEVSKYERGERGLGEARLRSWLAELATAAADARAGKPAPPADQRPPVPARDGPADVMPARRSPR